MKITVDIDCTPDEARRFLGLPDIAPLQEMMVAKMRDQLEQGWQSMDPESIYKQWMPSAVEGFDQMRKMFWSQMMGQTNRDKPE